MTQPTRRTMTARLLRWYGARTVAQSHAGADWYTMATAECHRLASMYDVEPERVCALVAVLSPRTSWHRNMAYAEDMLRDATSTPACLPASVAKARRLLAGEATSTVLGGDKVLSFYANLCGNADAVTVDAWMLRAVGFHREQPTSGQYETIADATRRAARKAGVTPMVLQATVWVVIREAA